MRDFKMPEAVFFDWDGTLVDSFDFLHRTHNHVRRIFGLGPFSLDEFGGYFGMPRYKLYSDIYGEDRIDEAKGHFEAYVMENHHELDLIDGAREVIDFFKDKGVPMGVVTNKKGALVRKEIENHGWADYFISVVGAGEAEADKPSAAPLILAIEKSGLNAEPSDIWYVGDTDNDLECAKGAGCPCVFIEGDEDKSAITKVYKPMLTFKNCRAFADFLLQTNLNSLQQSASI